MLYSHSQIYFIFSSNCQKDVQRLIFLVSNFVYVFFNQKKNVKNVQWCNNIESQLVGRVFKFQFPRLILKKKIFFSQKFGGLWWEKCQRMFEKTNFTCLENFWKWMARVKIAFIGSLCLQKLHHRIQEWNGINKAIE